MITQGLGLRRRLLAVAIVVFSVVGVFSYTKGVGASSPGCTVIVAKLDFGKLTASRAYAESEGLVGLSCTDVGEVAAARFELLVPKVVQVVRNGGVVITIGTRGDRIIDHEGKPLSVVHASDIEQVGRTTEVFFSITGWIEVASTFSGELNYDLPFQIDF